ncbi:hypothetical protein CEXT_344131 [Caerostris extrusa]|uniref:Uncharacterized protein n=1 Tax=Caerostris extrusa TaxID=172846 RepID=A0AAV4Y9B0_CAEEX|nr:hypothetical protein CEXT_344131 [Caerostris extrusa]
MNSAVPVSERPLICGKSHELMKRQKGSRFCREEDSATEKKMLRMLRQEGKKKEECIQCVRNFPLSFFSLSNFLAKRLTSNGPKSCSSS